MSFLLNTRGSIGAPSRYPQRIRIGHLLAFRSGYRSPSPEWQWLRLDDVEVLSDKASDGWTTIYLANGSRKYPIHMAQQQLCNGMQAVLLRHQSAGAFNHSDTQEQVIDFLLDGGHIIGDPKSISWYLAIEMSDEVVVEELQPSITETKTLGVRGVVQRWRGIPPARKWSVHVDVELARSLRSKEVDDLYSQFGVEERLLRGKRWSYRQCSALMS